MLKQRNETYDEFERRMSARADILFPSMKDKNKVKKSKNLPLGKSIYDDDDDDDENELLPMNKVKSPLEVLTDDKYNKLSDDKKDKTETAEKTRRSRTQEEENEILDLMYPSMKNAGESKTEISDKPAKTGMKVPETAVPKENNRPENLEKSDKIDNTAFSDAARKKARNFIQGAENFSEDAYQDEKGIWTIGYGHTKGVKQGDKITKEEAEKLYAEDFKIHSEPLKHVKVPLNDNEKAALASLIFNIGEPQFKNSTVLKKLNEGDKKGAAEAFKLFCKESKTKNIDGKPVKKLEFSKGLYNRRVKEMELFLTPDDK